MTLDPHYRHRLRATIQTAITAPKRKRIIQSLARQKFILQRGGNMVNGLLLAFVGAATFQERLADNGFNIGVVQLTLLIMGLVWLVGLLDVVFGLFKHEQEYIYENMTGGNEQA